MKLKIVAFGDSVTRGVRDSVPQHLSWTFILERILNSWLEEDVTVINAGVGGNTTEDALKRIEKDVLFVNPDLVLIMFGLNDQARVPLKKYKKNLTKIVTTLKRKGIEPILMTPNPITENYSEIRGYDNYLIASTRIRNYADVVREVAWNKYTSLIDINDFFIRNPQLQKFLSDGVHPDAIAQSAMASFIAKHVLSYLGVDNFPDIELVGFIKVYEDGKHNAFTDLVKWEGEYYIAFRNASSHFNPAKADGRIFIMKSEDLENWTKVGDIHVEGWDNRDPKLYVFNDKLYLFTQSWSPEDKTHRTFMFYTQDGSNWIGPYDCGEYVYWRPRYFAGYTYVAAYRGWKEGEEGEVHLLKSKDCINWKLVTIMAKGDYVNETDILFTHNEVIAFSRRERGARTTLMLMSKYPFIEWSLKELSEVVQSPAILKHRGTTLLAGRYVDKELKKPSKTALFTFANNDIKLIYEFPSGGDNAYPGLLEIGDGLIAVSYYSSHETRSKTAANIYLAIMSIT